MLALIPQDYYSAFNPLMKIKEHLYEVIDNTSNFLNKKSNLESKDKEILLKVRNLYKKYKNTTVLKNISFEVLKNQSVGIVGKSGSGKSTLAKILVGIEEKTQGKIKFNDIVLNEKTLKENRKSIQIIFQNSREALNPYRKIKNILADVSKNREDIIKIIKEVGLEKESLEKYPRQFSGGQAQRICIARALLAKPQLLILDEPTSNLDKTTELQILNLLKKLKEDKKFSYILISHNLNVIDYMCEKIIVIDSRKIIKEVDNKQKL